MESFEAWVAFLDVYGFRSLFSQQKKSAAEIATMLKGLQSRAEKRVGCGVTFTYFFSDAIVLVHRASDEGDRGLRCIEELIRHLSLEAISQNLALRGAVAHGDMVADRSLCVGQPLIEAYSLEQQMALPIVILPQRSASQREGMVVKNIQDIPLKDGVIRASAILPSPISPLRDLAERHEQVALVDGPASVAQVWRETRLFCDRQISIQEKNHV